MAVEQFDVIVIGAGSGLTISAAAADKGLKVAIVEEGPMGGTCLNRGCIPSKMLIHSADVIDTINNAPLFGIHPKGYRVDFKKMVNRVNRIIDEDARQIEKAIRADKKCTLFKTRGRFLGPRTLKVGNKTIKGKKVVIAAGTRPFVPPIDGIKNVPFFTSKEALRLKTLPKTMTIVGGGYIAAELAHFFGALGTNLTIIQRGPVMVPNEDKDIAEAFTRIFSKKYKVLTNHTALKVMKKGSKIITIAGQTNRKGKGQKRIKRIVSDQLLIATGRRSNTDLLDVGKTGVKVDKRGLIKVNTCMETSAKNIWALGDIVGKYPFKHAANLEAEHVAASAVFSKRKPVNYHAMPHAIFSSPQVAGVGETQQQLDARKAKYAVGTYRYINTGMGTAIEDREGFVKVYADKKTQKILGCHIMGSEASTLIHEVIVAMRARLGVKGILDAVHIHPALPEVVQRAFSAIQQ